MHGPNHDAHSSAHGSSTRAFAIGIVANLLFTALEAGYGFATDSLALLSDALHNFGDVLGLMLAWGAAMLAKRPPTPRHTYGFRRATLLSPLANSLLLVGFAGALAWEAIGRVNAPPPIPALPIIVVAAIGIAVNLGSALLLRDRDHAHDHAHDLNRHGAYLHLLADAAVSLAAVLAGIGMLTLGWTWLDPAIALLVGAVIAIGSWRLLRESLAQALDAVPADVDREAVIRYLSERPGVRAVHHVHIWALGAGEVALTAHLVRAQADGHDAFIAATARELASRFRIVHATIQIERGDGETCATPD